MPKGNTLLDAEEQESPRGAVPAQLVTELATAPDAALVPATGNTDMVATFERLARDPSVDVEKLERLIAMQERIIDRNAKADFDAAYAAMQGEIPVIDERGRIMVEDKLRSRYATNEDIQEVCKPIMQRHGFALRFSSEIAEGRIKVTGTLSHRSGHSESDEFVTLPDKTGSKNDIQAIGSARAYGQRYTTIALLNIATRGTDDDAKLAAKLTQTAAPEGYEAFAATLIGLAEEGLPRLMKAFNDAPAEFRKRLTGADRNDWNALKVTAGKVTNGRAS